MGRVVTPAPITTARELDDFLALLTFNQRADRVSEVTDRAVVLTIPKPT